MLSRHINFRTAIFIVMSSMIGTGIFITTGEILSLTQNALWVFILWLLGGMIALCGSLSYAELATMMPHSGGEYIYLRNIFGRLPAFLSGWVSLLIGFSASIAICAITLFLYAEKLWFSIFEAYLIHPNILHKPYTQKLFASVIIILIGIFHSYNLKVSTYVQNTLFYLKLSVVLLFIIFGFWSLDFAHFDRLFADYSSNLLSLNSISLKDISRIGLALLIISFAYSGWNGTAYIAEEIKKPTKNLPASLWLGTLITITIYMLMNIIFVASMPGEDVMKTKTIGEASAHALFSKQFAIFFNFGIFCILLSSLSVQILVGSRVYYAMAKDKIIFHFLAQVDTNNQVPKRAVYLQIIVALSYIFLGLDLNWLMTYMGFSLSIFPVVAVIGLLYIRKKKPSPLESYKTPFYPLIPCIYLVGSIGIMIAALLNWSESSISAIVVILAGIPIYFIWQKFFSMTS